MRIVVGTSGFSYPAWKGSFYPERMPGTGMLRYYAGQFSTVEINNTFHRMPKVELLAGWAEQVPGAFQFALKAPQQITHRARLKDTAVDATQHFARVAATLGDRLGPLLFQLPPYLKKDVPRLAAFLAVLPEGVRAAFEFRDPSWCDEQVYATLAAAHAATCIEEDDSHPDPPPIVSTAGWGYFRLRRPDYDDASLAAWAERIAAQPWSEAFVYFKHEDEGKGPRFAKSFMRLAAQNGLGSQAG